MSGTQQKAENEVNVSETPSEKHKREEQEAAAAAAAAGNIFSTSKPKDAMDGMGKGFGNILKGVVGGAAIIVSAPIKGLSPSRSLFLFCPPQIIEIRYILGAMDGKKQGGSWGALKGFGVGLGAGILGGTAMATAGAVTGEFWHSF
jgi:hypothetical protein